MPRIPEQKEVHIRRIIRDAIAVDPLISIAQIQKVVEQKTNRTIDDTYVCKLLKKVQVEMIKNVDFSKVAHRINQMREDYRLARESLLKIAYAQTVPGEPKPRHSDQVQAWRTIAMIGKILLDAELDLGIYNKEPDVIDTTAQTIRYKPLSKEEVEEITQAIKLWGNKPPQMREIERKEVIIKNTTNDTANTTIKSTTTDSTTPATIHLPSRTGQKLVQPNLAGGFQLSA